MLEGLLLINETDVYEEYGAFLCEDKAGDHANYSALLKPAAMKPYVSVAFREENGERLPDELLPASEARDVTLQFAIIAESATDFMEKYTGFVLFLKAGWLDVDVPETGKVFRMYCASCSNFDQLTDLDDGTVAARFSIKFREPNPSF
ncbi:hypothetical protein [Viscerimonas tarda]